MLKKPDDWLAGSLMVILFLQIFCDGFPTMAALYGLMMGISVLFGVGCLRGDGRAEAWDRKGVPEAAQKRFARIQGILFLVNAAIGPVGLLVSLAVDFDTDFLLLAQMGGLAAIGLLGLLPRGNKTARG